MKLIDILVQELPKRGGWPEDVEEVWQDYDRLMRPLGWFHDELCDDHRRQHHDADVKINRKQYEAALAASKPEWDGEGVPPVGMEIEYKFTKVNYRADFSRGKVLAYGMHNVFMEHWSSKNEFIQPLDRIEFRPIRSEADRRRDEAAKGLIEYLDKETDIDNVFSIKDVIGFYDAVATGKIPHIRID